MNKIQDLKLIRKDGNIITEGMRDRNPNWKYPCKVIRIEWRFNGDLISVENELGLFSFVMENREMIVISKALDEEVKVTLVQIYNGDGSIRMTLPQTQCINGKEEKVIYGWVENSYYGSDDCFNIVVEAVDLHDNYRVEINAITGEAVRSWYVR